MDKIRIAVIDDSKLMRQILTEILNDSGDFEVIGAAEDAYVARDLIKNTNPDVITLDVEMPGMNGITFLRNLMRLHPIPVVMVSTLTHRGASTTMEALTIGAVECVAKPNNISSKIHADKFSYDLSRAIRNAAKTKVSAMEVGQTPKPSANSPSTASTSFGTDTNQIIAIGASTGGVVVLNNLLHSLPINMPPIVIGQHLAKNFTTAFAEQVNNHSVLTVKEAQAGELLSCSHVYIAPGGIDIAVRKLGDNYTIKLMEPLEEAAFCPNIDRLFDSVADSAGKNAIGIIMTGMGNDGAQGLKKLQSTGAETIAQDKASSAIWGMPGAAVELKAANKVLSIADITKKILSYSLK